jgi:hypothetical protein
VDRDKIMNITAFGKTSTEVADRISREVPRSVQLHALLETYPSGVQRGKEFFIGSLRGEAGKSLRINIDTSSPWFMTGKDFESGDGIGGICKVFKEGRGWSIAETAKYFQDYLPREYVAPPENIVKPNNPINFSVMSLTSSATSSATTRTKANNQPQHTV